MRHCCPLIAVLLTCFLTSALRADDYPERAQDATIVETVLRLENFDLNSSEKGKTAVLRYLQHNLGSEKFFELVKKYPLEEATPLLLKLAAREPTETAEVEATRLLLQAGKLDALNEVIAGNDQAAVAVITAMGLSGRKDVSTVLQPIMLEAKRPLAVRRAAAIALGRLPGGTDLLLGRASKGQLPKDLHFTVGNILRASPDVKVRAVADEYLPLPATAGAEPLPPLAELVKRAGDAKQGAEIFRTKGTCAKCHKVFDEGKEIGPDLSEIGSKLTREAMYVAILDPSAGISHNFETYQAILDDGTFFTGLKISETDEAVTLRSAEGIQREIPQAEIDELIRQKISLMPADLQKLMTADELVDVVAYLASLKKKEPAE